MIELQTIWIHLLMPPEGRRIDLSDQYVTVGPYIIQGRRVWGPGITDDMCAKDILRLLALVPGVLVDIRHIGSRSGRGHGREIVTLRNLDGSIIYEVCHIDYCPGFSCSYSHGPWEEYGEYHGDAPADPDLLQALELKEKLSHKFIF